MLREACRRGGRGARRIRENGRRRSNSCHACPSAGVSAECSTMSAPARARKCHDQNYDKGRRPGRKPRAGKKDARGSSVRYARPAQGDAALLQDERGAPDRNLAVVRRRIVQAKAHRQDRGSDESAEPIARGARSRDRGLGRRLAEITASAGQEPKCLGGRPKNAPAFSDWRTAQREKPAMFCTSRVLFFLQRCSFPLTEFSAAARRC